MFNLSGETVKTVVNSVTLNKATQIGNCRPSMLITLFNSDFVDMIASRDILGSKFSESRKTE